jgi:hypothetical protein
MENPRILWPTTLSCMIKGAPGQHEILACRVPECAWLWILSRARHAKALSRVKKFTRSRLALGCGGQSFCPTIATRDATPREKHTASASFVHSSSSIVQSPCIVRWHCSVSVRPPGCQRKLGWDACARNRLLAVHCRRIHFWIRRALCAERPTSGDHEEGYHGHLHRRAAYYFCASQPLDPSKGCRQWEQLCGCSTQRMVLHFQQVANIGVNLASINGKPQRFRPPLTAAPKPGSNRTPGQAPRQNRLHSTIPTAFSPESNASFFPRQTRRCPH